MKFIWTYEEGPIKRIHESLDDLITQILASKGQDPWEYQARELYRKEIIRQSCAKDPGFCESRGMGDLVHVLALPVAKALDSVFGSRLSDCKACAKRRAWLNNRMPRRG